MVIFNPPIESHLVVPLPVRSSSSIGTGWIKTVDIYFRAQDLDNKLQPGDRVELWTDAPDHSGSEVGMSDGGWRAVKFDWVHQPLEEDGRSKGQEHIEPAERLVVPATPLSLTPKGEGDDQTRKLIGKITLPLPTSTSESPTGDNQAIPKSFEYTFRITYPDGRIWWLGGLGANGTVRFEPAEHENDESEIGTMPGMGMGNMGIWAGWTGYCLPVAVSVGAGDGPSSDSPIPVPLAQALQSQESFGLAHLWRDGQAREDHLWTFSPQAVEHDSRGQREEIFLVPRTAELGFRFDQDENEAEYLVLKGYPDLEDFGKGDDGGRYIFYRAEQIDTNKKVLAVGYPFVGPNGDERQNENRKIFLSLRSCTRLQLEEGVHDVCLYLPGMGKSEGGIALWNEETGGSFLVPSRTEPSGRVENPDDVIKVDLSLRLSQVEIGTAAFAHLECVRMYQFDNSPNMGLIGCSGNDLKSMEWVGPVDKEVEEDFEEVVLDPSSPSEAEAKSGLDDESEDESEMPGGMTASRGGSAWATAGSSGPRSMPGSDSASEGVKGEAWEVGLLSPRTVDLHEVEDRRLSDEDDEIVTEGSGEIPIKNKVDEIGNKVSSESDNELNHPDVQEHDRDPSPVSASRSGSGSGSSTSSEQDQIQPLVPNQTVRWIALFFRGLWMRTLGGFFRWMVMRFSAGQVEGQDERARILEGEEEADEETPLLGKARLDDPAADGEDEDGTLPIPESREAAIDQFNNRSNSPLLTPPSFDDPARIALPETPAPTTAPEREPTYKIITRTRNRTVVEPGYMKLVSGETGRVTLLTNVNGTLRVVHRVGEVETQLKVEDGDVEKNAEGLKVIRVDTTSLPDPFELRITRGT